MKTQASKRRSNFVRIQRAEGALTAYETVLGWILSRPINDVQAAIAAKVRHCRHEVDQANRARLQLAPAKSEPGNTVQTVVDSDAKPGDQ